MGGEDHQPVDADNEECSPEAGRQAQRPHGQVTMRELMWTCQVLVRLDGQTSLRKGHVSWVLSDRQSQRVRQPGGGNELGY